MDLDHDHTWTPLSALEAQVAKEDMWNWAKQEVEPPKVIPDVATPKWELPTLYAVYSYIRL